MVTTLRNEMALSMTLDVAGRRMKNPPEDRTIGDAAHKIGRAIVAAVPAVRKASVRQTGVHTSSRHVVSLATPLHSMSMH